VSETGVGIETGCGFGVLAQVIGLYGVIMGRIESSNMDYDVLFILNYYMLDVLDESEMQIDSPLLVVLKMTD
jgi:hypothetical protein